MNEEIVYEKYRQLTLTLLDQGLWITTMESCTSGMIASLITDTEGSSGVMKGALVTYSNEAKIYQGVPEEVIAQYGVYSHETASAMAEAAQRIYDSDLAIGVTGSMGNVDPANADSIPGQVYYTIRFKDRILSKFLEIPPLRSRREYKLTVADAIVDALLELLKVPDVDSIEIAIPDDTINFSLEKSVERMMYENHLDKLVILGHINPDGDAVGSVMGAAHYLGMLHPEWKIYPYISEKLGNGPGMLLAEEKTYHWNRLPNVTPGKDSYGVIVCDTATRGRIFGVEFWEGATDSIMIDHHLGNTGYCKKGIVKPLESCSELIYRCMDPESLRRISLEERNRYGAKGAVAADYLYLGILHDTQTFTRTNAPMFRIAGELLEMGVDHRRILATRNTKTLDDIIKTGEMVRHVKRYHQGRIAALYVDQKMQISEDIQYEDIHDLCNQMRDCSDVTVALTMFEKEPNNWKISVRSDGSIDMNAFAQVFGGGGHHGAAGLRFQTQEPERVYQDLIQELIRRMSDQAKDE